MCTIGWTGQADAYGSFRCIIIAVYDHSGSVGADVYLAFFLWMIHNGPWNLFFSRSDLRGLPLYWSAEWYSWPDRSLECDKIELVQLLCVDWISVTAGRI